MRFPLHLLSVLLAPLSLLLPLRGETMAAEHTCWFCAAPESRPDLPGYRKYAPDRRVDILHLKLELTPDFQKRSIQGNVQIRMALR